MEHRLKPTQKKSDYRDEVRYHTNKRVLLDPLKLITGLKWTVRNTNEAKELALGQINLAKELNQHRGNTKWLKTFRQFGSDILPFDWLDENVWVLPRNTRPSTAQLPKEPSRDVRLKTLPGIETRVEYIMRTPESEQTQNKDDEEKLASLPFTDPHYPLDE